MYFKRLVKVMIFDFIKLLSDLNNSDKYYLIKIINLFNRFLLFFVQNVLKISNVEMKDV